MKQSFRCALLQLLLGGLVWLPLPASAAVWHVAVGGSDIANGSEQQPFASLARAAQSAGAGDVILVRGGVYTAAQSVNFRGVAGSPVVIRPYPGEHAVFDGSATAANTSLVYLGGEHGRFEGFEVRNATRTGIATWGGKHLTIAGNTVHGGERGGIWMGHDVRGETRDINIIGNTIYRTCQVNNPQAGSSGWPAALVLSRVAGGLVEGNTVFENHGEGIGITESDFVDVRGNVVRDNFSVNLYFDDARHSRADGNLVYSTGHPEFRRDGVRDANGITLANETSWGDPDSLRGNTISNNIVIGNHRGISYGNFLAGGGMRDTLIAHNTVVDGSYASIDIEPAAHSAARLLNNIVVQQGGGLLARVASGVEIAGNCHHGGDPAAFGAADVAADPQFVDSGSWAAVGYRLQPGSGCAGVAPLLADVAQDYFQLARTGPVSAGAHEQDGGAPGDTEAPSVPVGLQASVNGTRVALAWQASTDDIGVSGYRVHRDGQPIGSSTGAAFDDATAVAGRSHRYAVAAVDAAGNVSALSSEIIVAVPLQSAQVASITLDASKRGKKWSVDARVVLRDGSGMPLAGAVVQARWSGGIERSVQGLATSDSDGRVTFPRESWSSGQAVTFTVTDVVRDGHAFDAAGSTQTSATFVP